MAYRLLAPPVRSNLNLIEGDWDYSRNRSFLVLENTTLFSNKPVTDDEWAARSKGDEESEWDDDEETKADDQEVERLKAGPQTDPFGLKDPASRALPSANRPGNPPARTPLKTAPPKDGGGSTMDFAHDMISSRSPKSSLGSMFGWDKDTSTSDKALDTLDLIGIVDPTGVADATAAIGHLASGDVGSAIISAAGIVPYIGDIGKVGKWGARGSKAIKQARVAGKESRLAGKAGAVAAAKPSRFTRAKEMFSKGKNFFGRAKDAHGKIQGRKADRSQGAPASRQQPPQGQGKPGGVGGKLRGAYDRLQAFRQSRKAKVPPARKATGPLSGDAPPPSLAPPDPGPLARDREAAQQVGDPPPNASLQRKLPGDDKPQDTAASRPGPPVQVGRPQSSGDALDAPPSGQGEVPPSSDPSGPPLGDNDAPQITTSSPRGRRGNIKQITVGADETCPAPQNKSSFFGTTGKRCHDQTPGRKH